MQELELAMHGMRLKEQELEVLAHNLANANTHGFKETRLSFDAMLAKQKTGSPMDPQGFKKTVNFSPGSVMHTDQPLDLAIQGKGFFEIQTDRGTFYTRNGNFIMGDDGELRHVSGGIVQGEGGSISIREQGDIQISRAGDITVNGLSQGRVKIVDFEDTSALLPVGAALFEADNSAQIERVDAPEIVQGGLESSNTNTVSTLVRLIDVTRQYQSYQKMISLQGELEKQAATSLGRLA